MSELVDRAVAIAREVHAGQERKGSGRPYFDAHLAPVADLVRGAGGTETQIAAAYLHDAAEDGGGRPVLDRIAAEVSPEVATLVAHLSDSLVDTTAGEDKEPWEVRKVRYLADLADAPDEALEVSVCDKLQNARCILDDLDDLGDGLWVRFSRTEPEYHLWYYGELAATFARRIPDHPATEGLASTVTAIAATVRRAHPDIDGRVDQARRALSPGGS